MLKKTFYTLLAVIISLLIHIEASNAQTLRVIKNGNVRSGPSTTEKIIGKVTVKQQVTQTGKSGDWYKVKLPGGKEGWVNKILVSPVAPSKTTGTTSKTAEAAPRPKPIPVRKIDESKLGPAAPENFTPISVVMPNLFKVASGTHCTIKGDTMSATWILVLNTGDVLEYSKSKDGPGKQTSGRVIYFNKTGTLDPIIGAVTDKTGNQIIPEGKNLIMKPHLSGATYSIWDGKVPAEYGPVAPAHLPNFFGIGSTVRFPSEWVLFGDKQYRNGGFVVTQLSIQFLPTTEVNTSYGKFIFYNNQWRSYKSE